MVLRERTMEVANNDLVSPKLRPRKDQNKSINRLETTVWKAVRSKLSSARGQMPTRQLEFALSKPNISLLRPRLPGTAMAHKSCELVTRRDLVPSRSQISSDQRIPSLRTAPMMPKREASQGTVLLWSRESSPAVEARRTSLRRAL